MSDLWRSQKPFAVVVALSIKHRHLNARLDEN